MASVQSSCIACDGTLESVEVVHLGHAKLFACMQCESWNYFPRPTASEQVALHDQADYALHPYFQTRSAQLERARLRCANILDVFKAEVKQTDLRNLRVLDVGCGAGEFLDAAQSGYGISPYGVDVSKWAVEETRKKGIPASQTTLEQLDPSQTDFPFVVAIDVIEHVTDPRALIVAIGERLSVGGVAYLETPNVDSVIYRFGAMLSRITRGWPAGALARLFPPHHIVYLSRESIEAAAEAAGLGVSRWFTRVLPASDIAVSPGLRFAFFIVQMFDRMRGRNALSCFVLKKD